MRYVAIDIEAIGLKPHNGVIWMLSITDPQTNKTKVIHDCNGMRKLPADVRKMLEDKSICKIIHSSQYDAPYIELVLGCKIRNIWDTDLCETVWLGTRGPKVKVKNIEPGSYMDKLMQKYSTALHYMLPRYKFKKPDKSVRENFIDREFGVPFTKKEITYAEDDTKPLPKIQKVQEVLLTQHGLMEVALLENTVSERYHDMKVRGIGFDKEIWRDIAEDNMRKYRQRLAKLPKDVSNWNSDKQVKKYFMDKGIHIPTYDDLDKIYLKTRNKILGDFIATREYSNAVNMFGLNWFSPDCNYIDSDGRIRCDVTQIIETGRNAMSHPNLQQMPGSGNSDPLRLKVLEMVTGGKKEKPQHRRAFVPKKGHVFVIGDFSGQEIGVMASASGEDLWINAMLRGEDIHGLTASLIDPVGWTEGAEKGCTFPKKCKCKGHLQMREPAKINNFMLAYGGGAQRFAEYTGTDLVTAAQYVGAHKRVIPKLTRYLLRNGEDALATGVSYSADPYRRRRNLRAEEAWQIKNQGKNNPIQSAGANMLKLAMISIPWKYAIVLVIHDEIICEVPEAQAKECAKIMKQVMEQSADYITGIKGLIRVQPKIQMNIMKDLPDAKTIKEIKGGNLSFAA
jgi:DNA polymerase I-like protein with 3'-5' exonuclease and polymerase domains